MPTTPHMISLPVGVQNQRVFPLVCDWAKDTEYQADFTSQGASNGIAVVQSVFINNEKCSADIEISISGTATNYTVMAGQVGVFPIYANGLPKISIKAEMGTGQTFLAFANFTQSLFAYNAQQIAQAVSDETLREAADTNPQNGHTAVTTYDPAVVQAIKDMQAATGLDFKFDQAGNALVSINTDKDANGGILTDVGNAALSNGALNTNATNLPIYKQPTGSCVAVSVNGVTTAPGQYLTVNPASAGAFNDTRLNFSSAGELKCQVGEITLNGGNVTVETGDKYDSNGSLISTLYDGAGKSVGTKDNPLVIGYSSTPTVTVGNFPSNQTVTIAGNADGVDLPVSIQNTPNVNVGNFPSVQTVQFSGTMPVQIENLVGIAGTPNVNITNEPTVNSRPVNGLGVYSATLPNGSSPQTLNCWGAGTTVGAIMVALGKGDSSQGSQGGPRVVKLWCDNGPMFVVPLMDSLNGVFLSLPAAIHFPNSVNCGIFERDQATLTNLDSTPIVCILSV